jgi:Tfp pilus assembly protein PilO
MDRVAEWFRRARWIDLRARTVPIATALLVILALNGIFYLFLTRPRLELAAGTRASFQELNTQIQKQRAGVEEVRDRLSTARCARFDLKRLRDEVLSNKVHRMTLVQKTLRELAQTFRMDPESIRYEFREVPDQPLVSFTISFPLRGSYVDLRQFLYHVEKSDHFLLIDSVGLSGSREGGKQLNLSIRLSTYFAVDDSPLLDAGPSRPTTRARRSGRRS